MTAPTIGRPAHAGRDDRKSAAMAAQRLSTPKHARVIGDFAAAREMYRAPAILQSGASAKRVDLSKPDEISFFFLDGEPHRKRRSAVAGMFAAKAIATRHQAVMNRAMDEIIAELRSRGEAPLDELSWQMAVDVAAEIIGLTNSDSNRNLANRVKAVLDSQIERKPGFFHELIFNAKMLIRVGRFWKHDIKPAVDARRGEPRDDVISHLLKQNAGRKLLIVECLSYGGAGMMTTREFIVMVAWHLFDNSALRDRFLTGGEDDQFAILEEILRLEPVASLTHRRAANDIAGMKAGPLKQGDEVCINIRAANTDEAITGACPFELDPDRAKRMKVVGPYMSFGDGPHRCPGAQVALHETRIFIDRLFRLPGITLVSQPEVLWNSFIQGYELRGAVVTCDPV